MACKGGESCGGGGGCGVGAGCRVGRMRAVVGARRVTVMGLGLFGGGAGAARFFAGLGARVIVTDIASAGKLASSVAALAGLGITFVLGEHRPEDFADTDLVVTNQAVRPDNEYLGLARQAGIPVVTETGLALALAKSSWLGVTGSSGKSTTTSLVAEMLGYHDVNTLLGGNIGGDLLTRMKDHAASSPLVVELSSFQLTWLAGDFASSFVKPPRVAVVTNLAPNHLDWHVDLAEYYAAKRALLAAQGAEDFAVLNADDPVLAAWAGEVPARVIRCGEGDPGGGDACFAGDKEIVLRFSGRETRFSLAGYRLPGRHNLANAIEAVAAAYAFSQNAEAVGKGLGSFPGLPHRLEVVGEAGGIRFINDSKSTTPEAAITALLAVEGPKCLIAGGYDKHSPFEALAGAIQERAAALVLVGPAGRRLAGEVEKAARARPAGLPPLTVVDAGEDFAGAVDAAFGLAPTGGVVLLSPACASYGMFVNYEERGRVFREIARRYAGGH